MTLGERIKMCRQNAGMSQEKVAELVGVSRQAVTKWEADQSAPNTENLFKLAEMFGTTVDLLLCSESYSKEAPTQQINEEKVKKHLWLILIPVCAILCFLIWQMGQEIGADIGEFIYNIRN